jgi:hypothetical protein
MAKWIKGISGNPRGRPKRGAALSDCLRAVGEEFKRTAAGPVQYKWLLARAIWCAALKGEAWAASLIFNRIEGLPLPMGVNPSEIQKIEVLYVEHNSIAIAGATPGADEDDPGGEALQRGLRGPEIRQELAGPGQADPAGAGGQANGLVCPDVPPAQ